jgi:hypothetical protein
MTVVPFKVLVLDANGVHPEQVMEFTSEFSFLDKLYYLNTPFEFAWARNKPYAAEILIDGEPS